MNIYVLIGLCGLLSILAVVSVVFSILYLKSCLKELDQRNIDSINEYKQNTESKIAGDLSKTNETFKQETIKINKHIGDIEDSLDRKVCDAVYSRTSFNFGEYYVKQRIYDVIKDKGNYFLVNNVAAYDKSGKRVAQIDHVLITPIGIFAIETKNWNGTTYILNMDVSFEKDKYQVGAFQEREPLDYSYHRNKLAVNIGTDGEVNLYRPHPTSNIIYQTEIHAIVLHNHLYQLTGKDCFIKGILLFVTNDRNRLIFDNKCDTQSGQYINDVIGIMSLDVFVDMLDNQTLVDITNSDMQVKDTKEMFDIISKLSQET